MDSQAWDLLISNIEDIKSEVNLLEKKIDKLALDVHTLKIKSTMWGLTGGAGGASIIAALNQFLGGS